MLSPLARGHRKNNQEKEKNENDHTRQVYAERRSRYTKAVEQLADEKAAVRLGGIYTLVGLVDEWLADDTLNPKERQKEGQVIINNLCSYIRSSFPLARKAEVLDSDVEPTDYEGDFTKDQAVFREEQDVRRSIFDEMSKRSSSFIKDKEDKVVVIPGAWSNFDIDFSRASIFYPLNDLTIQKGNFSDAKFYAGSIIENSKWDNLIIFDAVFHNDISFKNAIFSGEHISQDPISRNRSRFIVPISREIYMPRGSRFAALRTSPPLYLSPTHTSIVQQFHTDLRGREEDIDWNKNDITKFWGTNFKNKDTSKTADFCDTCFHGYTDFKGSIFEISALFRESKFYAWVKFSPHRIYLGRFQRDTF